MKVKLFLLVLIGYAQCHSRNAETAPAAAPGKPPAAGVVVGAQQLDVLLPRLQGKRVALVVNNTSLVGKTHLVDTLQRSGVTIVRIMGPEHGFRGNAADGQHVNDSTDAKTGIAVASLYGKDRKPSPRLLADVDVVVMDIQDVGTRFYTYISTMHYVMEACAESGKKFIVLDRPNPNAFVDGPVNEEPLKSFVAMHAIPIAHGLTIGELAGMINGEHWLANGATCDLEVVPVKHWNHDDAYSLPVRPSPNLPNDQAIRMYPYMCLFEGTVISLGRGTPMPFQVLGNPELKNMPFQFTPVDVPGVALNPPHEGILCYGMDLRRAPVARKIDLSYLFTFYKAYPHPEKFFTPYFDILAGTTRLKQQIKDGWTEERIRESWRHALDEYRTKRAKYLLYP